MTHADSPARTSADQTATSATDSTTTPGLEELPERVRVHALAKLLGSSSREVLTQLGELGETARSPQSSVPRATALRVAELFGVTGGRRQATTEEAGESATATAEQHVAETAVSKTTQAESKTTQAESKTTQAAATETAGTATGAPNTGGQAQPSQDEAGQSRSESRTPSFAAPSPVFLPPEPSVEPAASQVPDSQGVGSEDEPHPGQNGKQEGGTQQDAKQQGGKQSSQHREQQQRDRQRGGQQTQQRSDSGPDAPAGTMQTSAPAASEVESSDTEATDGQSDTDGDGARKRRRRGRRGRGRGRGTDGGSQDDANATGADNRAELTERSDEHGDQTDKQQDGETDQPRSAKTQHGQSEKQR